MAGILAVVASVAGGLLGGVLAFAGFALVDSLDLGTGPCPPSPWSQWRP